MSITAQAGILGFGPQVAKGTLATTWYRHRALSIDLDVQDDVREGPPEVGGIAVPTFPYKSGPIVSGGFTLQPRLEDTLGWMLYGLLGDVDTTPAGGGVYDHVFKMSPSSAFVPWMSFRKHIPAVDNDYATDLGQIFKDCKMVGGTLVLPNDAPVNMRADVLGREFVLADDPDAWVWANTFEHWESIPVACQTDGVITIGGDDMPVVAMNVGFTNVPLDIRQERIYGDPFLEDVTIIQRRLTYDMTVKWKNSELYRKVLTGTVNGTQWSGTPHTGAMHVKTVSSVNMPSTSERYSLTIDADEVMMTQVGGIQLAGNQSILMRFTGVGLEATNYANFTLHNKVASYVWPS